MPTLDLAPSKCLDLEGAPSAGPKNGPVLGPHTDPKTMLLPCPPKPLVYMPTGYEGLSPEAVAERTLEVVNAILSEYGAPQREALPSGRREQSRHCVMARALRPCGSEVVVGLDYTYIDCAQRPTPPVVREFIRRFDRGRYPDLVERDVIKLNFMIKAT